MMRAVSYLMAFVSVFVGVAVLREVIPDKAWVVMIAAAAFLSTVGSGMLFSSCWRYKSCNYVAGGTGGIGALTWCVLLLLYTQEIAIPPYVWLAPIPLVLFQWVNLCRGGAGAVCELPRAE